MSSIYKKFCKETFDEAGHLVDLKLQYPDNFNFGYHVVDAIAALTPEKRAVVWCNTENEERIFTFGEIKSLSDKAANLFADSGIQKGDKVMVLLKRHWEYWVIAVALHKLGAVLIPATHMLLPEDLVYRIRSAGVCAIICTPQNDVPEKVAKAAESSNIPLKLWTVQKDVPGFSNFNADLKSASEKFIPVKTKASDPMVLYFTSGTTGQPKGVIHDFTYPLAHIVTAKYWQCAEDDGLHFSVAETGWAKTSWGKIYGQWLVGSAVMVYDFDNFDPKALTHIINTYGVTTFCAPPTVYRYLVRKGIPDMPGLHHAVTAGEMLAPEVFRKFRERTGLTLYEGYGQTETTLLLANFRGETPVEGSMGTASPLYNIELRLKDNSPAPVGEIGEIVIVPPEDGSRDGIFSGYLDNELQYQYVWRNGVYHTGDAAWQDDNGHFWFHGRFDDIIKTGGFRVGPFEVENILMEHPAVLECSVIGVPDSLRGQSIKAVILLNAGYEASRQMETELRNFANSRLAEYKWVRLIEFVSEMPKTISGKIRKNELRSRGEKE